MEEKNAVFVDVETLSVGFSEFRLPQATDLVGKEFVLNYKGGYSVAYKFLDEDTLSATYVNGDEVDNVGAKYTALSPRKNVYYIDFVWSYGYTKSITTVVDFNKNIATTCVGTLPTEEEADISMYARYTQNLPLTSVKTVWDHAAVNAPFTAETKTHNKTNELVGHRIQWKYSENDAYEHIYLNENYYTWHCLKGVEAGLCDTDKCHFYNLDYGLIWFVWEEKIVPTIGSVIEDFEQMRSYGKLYGYKNKIEDGYVINFPAGSYSKLLNITKYDL